MIMWRKKILLIFLGAVFSALVVMPAAAKPVGQETASDRKEKQSKTAMEDDAQVSDEAGEEESKEPKHKFVIVRDVLEEQGLLYSLEETASEGNMEQTTVAETEAGVDDAGSVSNEAKTEAEVGGSGSVSVEAETENEAGDAGTVSANAEVEAGSETVEEDTSAIADAKEALLGFGLEEPAEDSEPAEITEPVVIDEAGEADEGTISVPDHPIAQTAEKMVFIGDSRTVDMMNAVHDGSVWACKVSMGYQWMATVGVPAVDSYIDAGTAVIILMGVNDPYNISNYIGYTNEKAAEWAARGATTYFVSVGPVDGDPYVTNAEIESFNAALQANLSGVYYIDIYSYLMANGFSTVDGTHYPDNVSIAIYNYIVEHLEVNRTGIWG